MHLNDEYCFRFKKVKPMNISKIKRFVADGDMSVSALRYLLECQGECEHLDYKLQLPFASDYNTACFVKDALAMKNVGGGYLVIGVKDKTWYPEGLPDAFPYDTKLLRDKVRHATGIELEIDVVTHEVFARGKPRHFGLILIRGTTKLGKLKRPSIPKSSFCPTEQWGIKNGEIYFRKGDETVRVSSGQELEDLLDDFTERHQLSTIESESTLPSPFEIENGLFRLLPLEYERFVERNIIEGELRKAIEGDPRIWIVNLFGPGGVGKSALASHVARHYYEQQAFDCILQLSAKERRLTDSGIKLLQPSLYSLENLFDNLLLLYGLQEYVTVPLEKKRDLVNMLLSDYKTLLLLDNMETVSDGRIMEFVRNLPASTKAKVLLTSRTRTKHWELPIRVTELSKSEVKELLIVKAGEYNLAPLPDLETNLDMIHKSSGGLPLAIQWMLGRFAVLGNWTDATKEVGNQDSPLLEFSFRNSWKILSEDAKQVLAVMSIFDNPPTARVLATTLDFSIERLEKAVEGANGLTEATFVSERIDQKTGKKTYHALPITLNFAQNQLSSMGDLEIKARKRYQEYFQQMELVAVETERYSSLFREFQVERDTEKKAIILARRADSAKSSLNYEQADDLFQQALEIDPRSVYVLVNYALLKHEMNQIGKAIELMREAGKRCTATNGFWVYYNFKRIYDDIKDRSQVEHCLRKALSYDNTHKMARHQLGMVVSRLGRYEEAIELFEQLINDELNAPSGPTYTLVATYKTKIISYQKAEQYTNVEKEITKAKAEIMKWPHLKRFIDEIDEVAS